MRSTAKPSPYGTNSGHTSPLLQVTMITYPITYRGNRSALVQAMRNLCDLDTYTAEGLLLTLEICCAAALCRKAAPVYFLTEA